MTCVVAIQTEEYAVMGSDRFIADSWVVHTSAEPKCMKRNGWLMGSTGPVRVNNAIRHRLFPKNHPAPTEEWIVDTLVPDLQEQLNKLGHVVVDGYIGGKEGENQGKVLFARPGCIFVLQADWSVDVWGGSFAAIGTGERYSQSSIETFMRLDEDRTFPALRHMAQMALSVASKFDNYTGGMHDIIHTEGPKNV